MARRQLHQLQYALTKVGLHHVDAVLYEVLVEMALLCEHRLAFHHLLHTMLTHDVHHDGVIFVGILGPVYYGAVLGGVALKLLKVLSQMGHGMFLYLTGSLTQLLPFLQLIGQAVALGTHAPEGLVVTRHFLGVAQELFCFL